MNKLWVRMQHPGAGARAREARRALELRILVGTNLSGSRARGRDAAGVRGDGAAPGAREVVNCKDAIAQQYLMECIVQRAPTPRPPAARPPARPPAARPPARPPPARSAAPARPPAPARAVQVFPVEYHQATLKVYLEHIGWLSASANARALTGMMDRVRSAPPPAGETAEASIFVTFAEACQSLVQKADDGMELAHALDLFKALLALALAMYPRPSPRRAGPRDRGRAREQGGARHRPQVRRLRRAHVGAARATRRRCRCSSSRSGRPSSRSSTTRSKEVASALVAKVLEQAPAIDDAAKADKLLSFVRPLVAADPDHPDDEEDARPKPSTTTASPNPPPLPPPPLLCPRGHRHAVPRPQHGAPPRVDRHARAPRLPDVFGHLRLPPRRAADQDARGRRRVRRGGGTQAARIRRDDGAGGGAARADARAAPLPAVRARRRRGGRGGRRVRVCGAVVHRVRGGGLRLAPAVAAIVSCIATLSRMGRLGEEQYETLASDLYSNKLLKPDQCRAVCKCATSSGRPPTRRTARAGACSSASSGRSSSPTAARRRQRAPPQLRRGAQRVPVPLRRGERPRHRRAPRRSSRSCSSTSPPTGARQRRRAFFTNTRLHLDEKKTDDGFRRPIQGSVGVSAGSRVAPAARRRTMVC